MFSSTSSENETRPKMNTSRAELTILATRAANQALFVLCRVISISITNEVLAGKDFEMK